MGSRLLLRLSIDYENDARSWWENGGAELWESIAEAPDAASIVLDEALALSWLAQAEAIEGWADGPEYAPHPISPAPVADDEDAAV